MGIKTGLQGKVLFPGAAEAELLLLEEPLSFWGGVNPDTGIIINRRHPQEGESISNKLLALPSTIGSSSSSAVLLELIRNNIAPAGILLGTVDAILIVACLVGREMNYACPPVALFSGDSLCQLLAGDYQLTAQGVLQAKIQCL